MLVAQNNNPFDFMGGPKAPPVEMMGGPMDKRKKALDIARFLKTDIDPSDPYAIYTPKQLFPPYAAGKGLIMRDKQFEKEAYKFLTGFDVDLVKRRSSNNYGQN